jgi:hypothetical protein
MRGLAALLSVVVVLTVAAVAFAANPKKGGIYSGTKAGVIEKRITLKVSKNGKAGTANLYCSGQHVSVMKGVVISKGKFSGRKMTGSVLVWKIKGSFSSSTEAKAKANLKAICDGGNVSVTMTLQS